MGEFPSSTSTGGPRRGEPRTLIVPQMNEAGAGLTAGLPAMETASLCCRQSDAETNEERPGGPVHDFGNGRAATQPVTDQGREPCEAKAPDRAGGDEGEAQRHESH